MTKSEYQQVKLVCQGWHRIGDTQIVSQKWQARYNRDNGRLSNARKRRRTKELRRRRHELDLDWLEAPADERIHEAFAKAADEAVDF